MQISVYRCVYIVGACIARPAILAQNCIAVGEKSLFSFEKSKKCSIFWRATNGRPYGILGTINTNFRCLKKGKGTQKRALGSGNIVNFGDLCGAFQ